MSSDEELHERLEAADARGELLSTLVRLLRGVDARAERATRRLIVAVGVVVLLVVGLAVVAFSTVRTTSDLAEQNRRDAVTRRDENCLLFERQEDIAIRKVQTTYNYLAQLPDADYGTSLTKAVLRNIGDAYTQAETTKAPGYCNAPNVGLPEPGLNIPPHPDFSALGRPKS